MVKVSVSILSSKDPKKDVGALNQTTAHYLHLDIMDGNFVPNKTASFGEIQRWLQENHLPLDVHLMVENPEPFIKKYALLNTEYITIHKEIKNLAKHIDAIKSYGLRCGVSIKPNTAIEDIFPLLEHIDLVLVMSVEPGAGGQTFLEDTYRKIKILKQEITRRGLSVLIEVDGGINDINKTTVIECGADILVAGSFILASDHYQSAIDALCL